MITISPEEALQLPVDELAVVVLGFIEAGVALGSTPVQGVPSPGSS